MNTGTLWGWPGQGLGRELAHDDGIFGDQNETGRRRTDQGRCGRSYKKFRN